MNRIPAILSILYILSEQRTRPHIGFPYHNDIRYYWLDSPHLKCSLLPNLNIDRVAQRIGNVAGCG